MAGQRADAHSLDIGGETRNEGRIRGEKCVFIRKLENFGTADWKRREFRHTTPMRACVLECGGKRSATPLSNGAGFRKRNLSLRRHVLFQKQCHRHRTPGPFGNANDLWRAMTHFLPIGSAKRKRAKNWQKSPFSLANSKILAARKRTSPLARASICNLQSPICNQITAH